MNTPNTTSTTSIASNVQDLLDRGQAFASDISHLLMQQEAPDAPTCASLAMNYEIWYKRLHEIVHAHAPNAVPEIESAYRRACGKCADIIDCMLSGSDVQSTVLSRIADALSTQLPVLKELQKAIV